jgi:hypothetical protein
MWLPHEVSAASLLALVVPRSSPFYRAIHFLAARQSANDLAKNAEAFVESTLRKRPLSDFGPAPYPTLFVISGETQHTFGVGVHPNVYERKPRFD